MCLCKYSSLTLWVYGKKNMNIFVITRLAVLFKIQSIPYRAVCTLLTCTFVPLSGCSKNLYWMGSLHSRCPFPKARKGNKTASAEKMRSRRRGGVILHTRSPFIPWNKANKVWFGTRFFCTNQVTWGNPGWVLLFVLLTPSHISPVFAHPKPACLLTQKHAVLPSGCSMFNYSL